MFIRYEEKIVLRWSLDNFFLWALLLIVHTWNCRPLHQREKVNRRLYLTLALEFSTFSFKECLRSWDWDWDAVYCATEALWEFIWTRDTHTHTHTHRDIHTQTRTIIFEAPVVKWLLSLAKDTATRVHILDEAVCISLSVKTLGKCINPTILCPIMGK